jgi:hypothetical protein
VIISSEAAGDEGLATLRIGFHSSINSGHCGLGLPIELGIDAFPNNLAYSDI